MKSTPEHNHPNMGIFRGIGSGEPCQRCILEHAAPDLLAACHQMWAALDERIYNASHGESVNEALKKIKAAIAKAEK